jgi:hypothetical protein
MEIPHIRGMFGCPSRRTTFPKWDMNPRRCAHGASFAQMKQNDANWNHSANRAHPDVDRSIPILAAQQELGLLPERHIGLGFAHSDHPASAGTHLTDIRNEGHSMRAGRLCHRNGRLQRWFKSFVPHSGWFAGRFSGCQTAEECNQTPHDHKPSEVLGRENLGLRALW